jgi:hypothetical protein
MPKIGLLDQQSKEHRKNELDAVFQETDRLIARLSIDCQGNIFEALNELKTALDQLQRPVVERLQTFLRTVQGHSFHSYEETHRLVVQVRDLMDRLNLGILCPKSGERTRLGSRKKKREVNGRFTFQRVDKGKTITSIVSETFPATSIVTNPPSRQRRGRPTITEEIPRA